MVSFRMLLSCVSPIFCVDVHCRAIGKRRINPYYGERFEVLLKSKITPRSLRDLPGRFRLSVHARTALPNT